MMVNLICKYKPHSKQWTTDYDPFMQQGNGFIKCKNIPEILGIFLLLLLNRTY